MRAYKNFFLSLVFIFSLTTVFAQYENTSGQKKQQKKKENVAKVNRWFAGGMIGGGFSSTNSYFEVAPIVGYRVTPDFHVGSRITYIYNSYTVPPFGDRYTAHHYGASIFTRYTFLRFLMAQVEYEALSVDYYDINRRWVQSLFVGGGLYQSMGGRGFATVAIYYNILDDQYSPYNNPIVRIGFGFGF